MNCTVLKACTKQKSLEQQGKKGVAKRVKSQKKNMEIFERAKIKGLNVTIISFSIFTVGRSRLS